MSSARKLAAVACSNCARVHKLTESSSSVPYTVLRNSMHHIDMSIQTTYLRCNQIIRHGLVVACCVVVFVVGIMSSMAAVLPTKKVAFQFVVTCSYNTGCFVWSTRSCPSRIATTNCRMYSAITVKCSIRFLRRGVVMQAVSCIKNTA